VGLFKPDIVRFWATPLFFVWDNFFLGEELWWFFDGENVVGCVVNVVFWQSVFWVEKMRQVFRIYFFLVRVLGRSGCLSQGGTRGCLRDGFPGGRCGEGRGGG
jgi:hypothetical protein